MRLKKEIRKKSKNWRNYKLTILGTKWCQLNWPIQLDRGQNRNRIWKSSQIGRNQISGRTPTKLIKLNPLNTMLLGLAKNGSIHKSAFLGVTLYKAYLGLENKRWC